MSDVVNSRCGYKIKITNKDLMIDELKKLLIKLSDKNNIIKKESVIDYAKTNAWSIRERRLKLIYESLDESSIDCHTFDIGFHGTTTFLAGIINNSHNSKFFEDNDVELILVASSKKY